MENTTYMMSTTTNHVYQQVCYVERNNETIYYTNQWSSTSVESMSVFKHPAETTSYNHNYTPAAKNQALAASHNQNNALAANIQALAASDSSNKTVEDSPDSKENTQKKSRATTSCEEYIHRFFAGEDIGVNGLEKWIVGV